MLDYYIALEFLTLGALFPYGAVGIYLGGFFPVAFHHILVTLSVIAELLAFGYAGDKDAVVVVIHPYNIPFVGIVIVNLTNCYLIVYNLNYVRTFGERMARIR